MVEATYRTFQPPNSIPPPIPYKKPRPASVFMMNYPPPAPPSQLEFANSPSYEQYGSDRLHPNSSHRREQSSSSGGSFSMYQLQRDSPTIKSHIANSSIHSHGHPVRHGSISTPITASSSSLQDAYVTTLRKQKATVWCERAQTEDPRIIAAQRAAKQRAGMEIGLQPASSHHQDSHSAGGSSSGSPASSLYGGNSGHHKANKILVAAGVMGVNTVKKKTWVKVPSGSSGGSGHFGSSSKRIVMDPGSLIVGAVPTRLSATEVMGDSSDEDGQHSPVGTNGRRRVGRNSFNSSHRPNQRESERQRRNVEAGQEGGLRHATSTGSKSSQNSQGSSTSTYSKATEAPSTTNRSVAQASSPHYSPHDMTGTVSGPIRPEDYFTNTRTPSSRSSSADNLGPLLMQKVRSPSTMHSADLRRMGSVDERDARTRTMSGVRLYVANPDT